ncbi:hypothetical protein J1N35_038648, partial [Gossypium stocksii]
KAEVPTSTSPSRNDEGFNIRMIDHLTSSIELHNRVITKMKSKEVYVLLLINEVDG